MRTALTLAAALLLSAGPARGQEEVRDLSSALGAYLEERREGQDVMGAAQLGVAQLEAARAEVARALAVLGRERGVGAPLSLAEDLGAAVDGLEAAAAGPRLRAGKVVEEQLELADGTVLEVAWRLPEGNEAEGEGWPLLVIAPGEGEDPLEHLHARWTDPELRSRAILLCVALPGPLQGWTRVAHEGRAGGLRALLSGTRVATERLAVDPDRVFLVGHSEGVSAVLAAANYRPHRFAGVVAMSGDVIPVPADNFHNLPLLFIAAGARARAFEESVRASGGAPCTLRSSGKDADVWAWARELRRPEPATSVRILPTHPSTEGLDYLQPFPVWVDWLQVHPSAAASLAQARVERVENRIVLETTGIARATLLLSDGMLDLDQPVELVVNGETSSVTVERELSVLLDCLARGESDGGRVHVASLEVELEADVESEDVLLAERLEYEELGEEEARARGLVEVQGEWVHREESRLLRKGYRRHESGLWLDREEQLLLEKGWRLQDTTWIDVEEIDQLEQGLWKVAGSWLPLDVASQRRSRVDSMWRIPGPRILLNTTASRPVAARARMAMRASWEDMRRVLGVEPPRPLEVTLLSSEEQYDRLAAGDAEGLWPATHRGALHTIHTAFFAEGWFQRQAGELAYAGQGVGYWDHLVPYGDSYGYHAARHALGLSYVHAVDPAPKAVRGGPRRELADELEEERRLPRWLRHGAAVYAERYFQDVRVKEGGDPWWARRWSLENLEAGGGLRPLDEVLAFELEGRERADAQRLLIEAGLLVAFVLDGGCAPLEEVHREFKRALALDRLRPSHVEALVEGLLEHEAELRAFARL